MGAAVGDPRRAARDRGQLQQGAAALRQGPGPAPGPHHRETRTRRQEARHEQHRRPGRVSKNERFDRRWRNDTMNQEPLTPPTSLPADAEAPDASPDASPAPEVTAPKGPTFAELGLHPDVLRAVE